MHFKTQSVRYDVAYSAAHDIGEGFLAAHGLRTASGPGQHATVGLFLVAIGSAESESAINVAASLVLRARMTLRSLPRQWFSGFHRTAQPRLT